jgi:hypothetical protein
VPTVAAIDASHNTTTEPGVERIVTRGDIQTRPFVGLKAHGRQAAVPGIRLPTQDNCPDRPRSGLYNPQKTMCGALRWSAVTYGGCRPLRTARALARPVRNNQSRWPGASGIGRVGG